MRPPREVLLLRMEADGTCVGVTVGDANGTGGGAEWRVRGAVPGSRVLAFGRPKSASVLKVLEPSPGSIAPRCAQFGTCGGCLLQPLPVARQRAAKLDALRHLLASLGGDCGGMLAADGDGYGYRNKLEVTFGTTRYLSREELDSAGENDIPDRCGRFVGMHGPGHFDRIVDTPRCEIADEAINLVLQRVRKDTLESPFPLWEPRAHTGFWRHLVLRRGGDGRTLLLVYTSVAGDEERAWLRQKAPSWGADAVCWYMSDRTSDAAVGELAEVLHGTPILGVYLGHPTAERPSDGSQSPLGTGRLDLAPTAFFQVHDAGATVLLEVVAGMLGHGGTLLDLYCGVGAFGLALRSRFRRIGGIELNDFAVLAARDNARRLGVVSAYRSGAVEYELPALLADFSLLSRLGPQSSASPDRLAVLVDPPRSGLHPKALATIGGLQADVLVYVACKPASLARDAVALLAAGWRCEAWTAVDLFPQTPHTEVVARFVRVAPG